jgi:hypothetical protein
MTKVDYVMHSRSCSAFYKYPDLTRKVNSLQSKFVRDVTRAKKELEVGIKKAFAEHGISVNPPEI